MGAKQSEARVRGLILVVDDEDDIVQFVQDALEDEGYAVCSAFDGTRALQLARQQAPDLETADVVLVGVSRTSKTPTCIYLAQRGVRAANVPLVPGAEPPAKLFNLKRPIVVGLTVSPDRLVSIRRNRLLNLNEHRESSYVENDAVREEIIRARRLFEKHRWPVIDVTRRSIEETAAAVVNLLNEARSHRLAQVVGDPDQEAQA